MSYLYIFGTIVFTVYGQLILKWKIAEYGSLPAHFFGKIHFLLKLLFDPYIFSGFVAAFVASLFWMAAMTKFDLSYAYLFVGLTFALVLIFSAVFFYEPLNVYKVAGVVLIIVGIVISSRGM